MKVEERIYKVFEKVIVSCDISALDAIVPLRTEVLQILADFKIIPLEKWRELLKLWENLDEILHQTATRWSILKDVEEWKKKIEDKLEEIEK